MKTSLPLLPVILSLAFAGVSRSMGEEAQPTGLQMYEKGKAALERGDLPLARRCFEHLLKVKPDLELARIQLAQVAQAEREQARIPKSLKSAKAQSVGRIEWDGVALSDAIATVAKQLEKAGASEKLVVNVGGHLPEAVGNRSVTMSVANVPFDHVLEALGYAGDVSISYTKDGIAAREVTGARQEWDAGDPKSPRMSAGAKKIILDRFEMKEASVRDALDFLQKKAAEVSRGSFKPIFVLHHGFVPRNTVTLDLRGVSLYDAVRSVCLVAESEERWYPWGAGIGNRQAATAAPEPSRKEAAPK